MEARRETLNRERIVDIEFKISRLGILGKEYYDLAQIKLKRHRSQISIARTQNVLLHAALSTLREKDRIARKNAGDLENLRKKAAALRVHFDHQRQRVFKRQRKLEWQITGTHAAELDCAGVLDPNTPPELRIRSLEYKLSRVHMKMQDVQILVKHYEGTLQPLRDEWTVYDSKLATLQTHVNIKNQECELLINTHHDAIRARDSAKIELEELLSFIFGYGKKGIISPELRFKILRAINEIKSVMDIESMRGMYHQLLVQEKQTSYLESICEEMSRTFDLMRDDGYRPSRRSSIRDGDYAERVIDDTVMIVRRQSQWRGSSPLLLLLESTKSIVSKLQEGQFILESTNHNLQKDILEKCKASMMQMLQSLYRKMKRRNKETLRRAEFEAKEAAHWAKEEAEVARKKRAAEEARRKYEERAAVREAQRAEEHDLKLRQIMEEESQEAADDVEEEEYQAADDGEEEEYQAADDGEEEGSQAADDVDEEEYQAADDVDEEEYQPLDDVDEEEYQPLDDVDDEGSQGADDVGDEESQAVDDVEGEAAYDVEDYEGQITEAADEMAEPIVIFLPTFPQAPFDDREVATRGRAHLSSSDESEGTIERSADPGSSAAISDDESTGASTTDEGRDGRVTPSKAAPTGPHAGSSRFGRAATFTETREAAGSSRLGRAATFTGTARQTAVRSRIAASPDHVETVSRARDADKAAIPAASLLEPDRLPTVLACLASEEGVEQQPVIPTGLPPSGDSTLEATMLMSGEKSIESTVETAESTYEGALPDVKSPSVVTSEHVSTTESPPGSRMGRGDKTPSPELSPEIIREFSHSALQGRHEVPGSTTISKDSHEKVADPAGEGRRLKAVATVSSETVQGLSLRPVSIPVSSDVTVETLLPRSPSGAPVASRRGTPGEKSTSPETVSIDNPALPQTPKGGHSLSPKLPRSPSGAPISAKSAFAAALHPGDEGALTPSDPSELGADVRAPTRPASELLPSTPGEMPREATTSIPRGKGVAGEVHSVAKSPRTAEIVLPRSPSGAPIASGWEHGAKVLSPDIATLDHAQSSLPQTFGGLRSPNVELPISPSGAPVATAARFPFGSHLSEISSPSAGSSGTSRSPTDTARLEPVPHEERFSARASPGTRDP